MKLETVYSTVASYDTLISNICKVTQDINDKRQVFMIKLEAVLNQIRSRFPEKEIEEHLQDHLFHGMMKTLRDSLHYQYDDPNLIYTGLLLAAQKAESEAYGSRVTNSVSTIKWRQPKYNQWFTLN